MIKFNLKLINIGLSVLLLFGVLILMQLVVSFDKLPTIVEIFYSLQRNLLKVSYRKDIFITLYRILKGFILASILGVGLAMGVYKVKLIYFLIYPIVEILRPIPNVVWIPISILLFKEVEYSIIFIIFLGAFFPVFTNSFHGLKNINTKYIKNAKLLQIGKINMLLHIYLPAISNNIFTGLSLGMGGAWLAVIMSEIISGRDGIGYETWKAYMLIDYSGIIAGMIVIGLLGALCSYALKVLKMKIVKWEV